MTCSSIALPHQPGNLSLAAVGLCDGDPKALFALAFTSMIIVRSGTLSEPGAVDFLTTASLALSELLGITGEARP